MKRSFRSVEIHPIEGNQHEYRIDFYSWDTLIAKRVVNIKSVGRVTETWIDDEVTPPKQGD